MLPTTIHEAPALDSFTTLADHQSQTPDSFYDSKPVLHHMAAGARAVMSLAHVSKLPVFAQSADPEPVQPGTAINGVRTEVMLTEVVDVYVTSENLTLFNHARSAGVSIPYTIIAVHYIQTMEDPANSAQKVKALYMQLELNDPDSVTDDDEGDFVEVTLIPASLAPADTSPSEDVQAIVETQTLYEAISNCSNLHPDPGMDGDEEMSNGIDSRIQFEGNIGYEGVSGLSGEEAITSINGLPPAFPGSGGWITADNWREHFDEEGNWLEQDGQALGEGAGRVRTLDEIDGEGVNGHVEEDANKRPRTD